MKGKISLEEYRKIAGLPNTRNASAVHSSYKEAAISAMYDVAIQTIRDIQSISGVMLFGYSPCSIRVEIPDKARCDGSNALKGCEDALNKIAYWDDKQIRKGSFEFC